jgi:hypothetical protein
MSGSVELYASCCWRVNYRIFISQSNRLCLVPAVADDVCSAGRAPASFAKLGTAYLTVTSEATGSSRRPPIPSNDFQTT